MKDLLPLSVGALLGYLLLELLREREENPYRQWSEEGLQQSLLGDVSEVELDRALLTRVGPHRYAVTIQRTIGGAPVPVYAGEVTDTGSFFTARSTTGETRSFGANLDPVVRWLDSTAKKPGYLRSALFSGSILAPLFSRN